jgi:acyl-CoA oxidase
VHEIVTRLPEGLKADFLMGYSTLIRDRDEADLRQVIRTSAFQLAQALAITTRYSVVRCQGNKLSPSGFGTPIIKYKQQHYRLLSLISRSYATLFAWNASNDIYTDTSQLQKQGDYSNLPYVHMLMCGLKAWSSQTAADGAEEARKMCGGHGYMAISGLPDIVASVTATCTFEGENYVMWGQVAKYLMKGMDSSALPADMAYMESHHQFVTPCLAVGADFLDHGVILHIFQQRAAALTYEAHALVKAEERKGRSRAAAEDAHALPLLSASRAHIEVFILTACVKRLALLPLSTPRSIPSALSSLISLFGLTTIASPTSPFSGGFLTSTSLTGTHLREMQEQIDGLLAKLLPDAVALTDAWSFTDGSLKSAIGCRDGDAYKRIMEWTRQLPINVEAKSNNGVFKEGWEEVIEGFLRRELKIRPRL